MLPDVHVFFRHSYKILKLRIICSLTRPVLMCKNSVYFSAPSLRLLWRRYWQIVVLKTNIKTGSMNAAANCNEHIFLSDGSDDAMPTLLAQC